MNVDQQTIQNFAKHWIKSWNNHDLDAIISHYAEELTFISPLIVERLNRPNGTITDREELKAYFKIGLDSNPNLHFELEEILYSVKGFTIYYKKCTWWKNSRIF